ncbi:MAG: hypothetical protein Q9187_006912, partial [Circinaria calcarea]
MISRNISIFGSTCVATRVSSNPQRFKVYDINTATVAPNLATPGSEGRDVNVHQKWDMADATLHTSLEMLLFFQSLRVMGVETTNFSKISNLLGENEFVRENRNYRPDRLSADSLQQLYLRLLKDEVQSQRLENSSPVRDGDKVSKKRKLSPSPLHSIDEAAEHNHLLPQLVNRLYARYRDNAVKAIQDEEIRYKSLQKEIHEIEEGEWDARLQQQEIAPRRESKGVSSIQTLLHHDDSNVMSRTNSIQHGTNLKERADSAVASDNRNRSHSTVANAEETQPGSYSPVKPDAPKGPATESYHSRTPSATGVQQVTPLHQDSSQGVSRQTSQSQSHVPYLPPIGYNMPSPTADGHRRLPYQQQMGVPLSASPRLNQIPLIPPDRSSASPIILPPPVGMIRSAGSPSGSLDALADMAGQQYRANQPIPSPRSSHAIGPSHHPHLPQPRNYMQRAYPYYDSQIPYTAPYPNYGQPPLPPYHSTSQPGVSPFPPPNHSHPSMPRQQSLPQYQPPLTPYPPYQGYSTSQAGYQAIPQVATPQNQVFRHPAQRTPGLTTTGKRRPPKLFPIDTSASSTKWKRFGPPGLNQTPGSPTPPRPEDISPLSEKSPSPIAESLLSSSAAVEGNLIEQNEVEEVKSKAQEALKSVSSSKRARGGRSRGSKPRSRGARAASTASSALAASIQTRTRSHSINSHTDELSIDTIQNSTRKIKPEPPATPATAIDDAISTASTPRDDSSRKPSRRGGKTLRSLESAEPSRPTTKRKRATTIEETPDISMNSPFTTKPTQVLASRNFPRTSAPIMNDITAHKLASMFAKPLTERDAPGYKDHIYRPQDLKSIKSAISAGSRAVVAANDQNTPAADDIGSPGKSTASFLIDASKDVMPPKGIVNSAQLEKEICRMFANAVMFNPDSKRGFGPAFRTRSKAKGVAAVVDGAGDGGGEEEGGGVVKDAREMFEA